MNSRNTIVLLLLALVLLPLAAGCTIRHVHAGNRVTPAEVALLPALSTKKEVLERIGPPAEITLIPKGSVFIYRHVKSRGEGLEITAVQASFESSESDTRDETLRIEFDKSGRVVSYGFDGEGVTRE